MAENPNHCLCRMYWGACAGRSALSLACIQAARSEFEASEGRRSFLLLMDYSKFSESMPLAVLGYRLPLRGMSMPALKSVFDAWRAPRSIRLVVVSFSCLRSTG
eukprot:4477492-Pyramimonas_sp.AAC.1